MQQNLSATQQQMTAQSAQGGYPRQLNPQQFRMNATMPAVGGAAAVGGTSMAPHFGTGLRQQATGTAPDPQTRFPMHHMNVSDQQSTAPARERQQQYTSSGTGATTGHHPSAYFQGQVPQPNYGQGRTPSGYGQSQGSGYGSYSGTSAGSGAQMYRQQSGSSTPHTPVTPSTQQQAYGGGMRSGGMPTYGQQPPNSYQNFQGAQQSGSSYGGRGYPGGMASGGYANDPSQASAQAMGAASGRGGSAASQFAAAQQYQQQQPSMGGHPGQHRGFGQRQQGRGGGYGRRGGGRGGQPRLPGGGRGRGGRGTSFPDSSGAPTGAVKGQAPRQASGPGPTATEAPSGGPPTAGPDPTEDPNVAPEKRSIPRRQGIEPPIRNLLQTDQPMFNEPERFFRVLTFDVLGDKVPRSARAHQKPPPGRADFWSWDYRKDFLIKEITQFQPDVICLQEVDHYDFFEQKLAPLGYVGIFEPRRPTGQSRLYVVHGLATFWQATKFEYMGRRTEPLGAPFYVNEIGLCARLCRIDRDPRTNPTGQKTQKNVVLDIWNTHLIEGRTKSCEKRRMKQAQELMDHIARVSNMDLDDRSYGRPRIGAERNKPLMQPKAEVEQLPIIDPQTKPAATYMSGGPTPGGLPQSVLDMESNKEDQPDNKEMEIRATDPESKEHEPGTPLQELFRERMAKAISIGSTQPMAQTGDSTQDVSPEEDYNMKKRNLGPPPDSLRYPVICCGNFNCVPYPDPIKKGQKDFIQPVTYAFMTYNSEASRSNEWLRDAFERLPPYQARRWTLDSAYASSLGEPSFTMWPDKKLGQLQCPVDYVFFTKKPANGLALIGILEPLHEDWVKAGAAQSLPCHSFPSDHIPLMCDFEFRQT